METVLVFNPRVLKLLAQRLAETGFSDQDILSLASDEYLLSKIRQHLQQGRVLNLSQPTLEVSLEPLVPYDNWRVAQHQFIPAEKFSVKGLNLLSLRLPEQILPGWELWREVKNMQEAGLVFANDDILNFLMVNQELIPVDWLIRLKEKCRIFFFGTTYLGNAEILCVRYIYYTGTACAWHYLWLNHKLNLAKDLLATFQV